MASRDGVRRIRGGGERVNAPGERCVCGKIVPYGGLLNHLDCVRPEPVVRASRLIEEMRRADEAEAQVEQLQEERDRYLSHLTIACSILADVGLTERYEAALSSLSEQEGR